jgi:hypothetical protein
VILGFYAGKSHNLIGLGILHGDLDFFDLHEKSLDLSNYEIFPHKILKSRTFKKSSILIVILYGTCVVYYLHPFPILPKYPIAVKGDQYFPNSNN